MENMTKLLQINRSLFEHLHSFIFSLNTQHQELRCNNSWDFWTIPQWFWNRWQLPLLPSFHRTAEKKSHKINQEVRQSSAILCSKNRPRTLTKCEKSPTKCCSDQKKKSYTSSFAPRDSESINESLKLPLSRIFFLKKLCQWEQTSVCLLRSHESNGCCCSSQPSPDSPPCRSELITLHPRPPSDTSCHTDGFHDAATCQMHQWW